MTFEHDEHVLLDAVHDALEPDYGATLRGIVSRARDQLRGHPADEIYDVIVEQASADLPGFEPNTEELMRVAFGIQEGTLDEPAVQDVESDPTPTES